MTSESRRSKRMRREDEAGKGGRRSRPASKGTTKLFEEDNKAKASFMDLSRRQEAPGRDLQQDPAKGGRDEQGREGSS